MLLFPRLALPEALTKVRTFAGAGVPAPGAIDLTAARFAPTGGIRVDPSRLRDMRADLTRLAGESDLEQGSQQARQRFDRSVMQYLSDQDLPVAEMVRPECWAWVAVILIPDLVHWRFRGNDGHVNPERYCGPLVRNAIGRLWLRAWVLGSDAALITEDAAVAILERPSVASHAELARSILRHWTDCKSTGIQDPEGLLREVMKRIRLRTTILDTLAMPADLVEGLVAASFAAEIARRAKLDDDHPSWVRGDGR